jgi:GDPmannose 4,6-dehydratase
MWLMLNQDDPEDYVIATGEEHTVKEFIEASAPFFDMEIEWRDEGVDEIGVDVKTGKTIIAVNDKYFRPAEVDRLIGDSSKARKELGWKQEYTFYDLVREMCLAEL